MLSLIACIIFFSIFYFFPFWLLCRVIEFHWNLEHIASALVYRINEKQASPSLALFLAGNITDADV